MKNAGCILLLMLSAPSFVAKGQVDPFDSYGTISWDDEKTHLDNFALALQHDPDSTGYIIVYAGRQACVGEARDHAQRAKKYVVETRGIQESRIKAIDGGYRAELTVILQPAPGGSPELQPSSTIKPSEVQIIKNCKRNRPKPRKSRGSLRFSSLLFPELPVICPGNAPSILTDGSNRIL